MNDDHHGSEEAFRERVQSGSQACGSERGLRVEMRDVHFGYTGSRKLPNWPLTFAAADCFALVQILRGVSVDLQPGTSMAFVGSSGSGESSSLDAKCIRLCAKSRRYPLVTVFMFGGLESQSIGSGQQHASVRIGAWAKHHHGSRTSCLTISDGWALNHEHSLGDPKGLGRVSRRLPDFSREMVRNQGLALGQWTGKPINATIFIILFCCFADMLICWSTGPRSFVKTTPSFDQAAGMCISTHGPPSLA
eukprot:90331-Pelagomonas_calceolata.AAC.5